jgi:uncharacterized membrane protein (UPF0127 family)
MKRTWAWLALAIVISAGCFIGCGKSPAVPSSASAASAPSSTTPAVAEDDPNIPTHAQAKLETIKLWMGREEMITEMCLTGLQRQTGMMFRTNMAENEGMIFVFDQPHQAGFWMKNTILPLSCAYIDHEGKIVEIHDMKPQDTNTIRAATNNIQFVLETKQGWFERHNIKAGMVVTTEKGSLKKTFLEK